MVKKKADGESIPSQLEESGSGDLSTEVEQTDELSILEMTEKSGNFSLKDFLEENPEVIVSELNKVLHWISTADNWFVVLQPIMAQDGTVLVRFTLSPPKNKKLVVYEDESDKSKQIVIESLN